MSQFATAAQRYAALLPPDLYDDMGGQFANAARETTIPAEAEPEPEASRERSGGGEAMGGFEGSPKPVPGDELAAAAYHRDPDARTDNELMREAGRQAAATPAPEPSATGRAEDEAAQEASRAAEAAPQGFRPNYASLNAEHTQAREKALLPQEAKAEAAQEQSQQHGAGISDERKEALLPAAAVAEVEAQRPTMEQQRQRSAGLSM